MTGEIEQWVDLGKSAAAAESGLLPFRHEFFPRFHGNRHPFENPLDHDSVLYHPLEVADDHPTPTDLAEAAHDNQAVAWQHAVSKANVLQPAEADDVRAQAVV